MRADIQERISAAISELDYRPNLAARAMRTTRTGRVAVLLPEGAAHSSVEVLHGAAEAAREGSLEMDVLTLGGVPAARTHRSLELLQSGLFEAVLSLTPLGLTSAQVGNSPRVVEFPLYDAEMHGIGKLADASALTDVVAQLAALGHRKFIHLAGAYSHASARTRRDVYLESVSRAGAESVGVIQCDWAPESARNAILDLQEDSEATAVVCANDALAAAAIKGALERGWRVPQRLSITGFDAQGLGEWMTPSLTSVMVDHEELGRQAMSTLIAAMHGEQEPHFDDNGMTVVWRESTGAAPGLT